MTSFTVLYNNFFQIILLNIAKSITTVHEIPKITISIKLKKKKKKKNADIEQFE